MNAIAPPKRLTHEDVERVCKHYELIDGEQRQKAVDIAALLIATQICKELDRIYSPEAFAIPEPMLRCFGRSNHALKPDVAFIWRHRLPEGQSPSGDLTIAPDLVAEILSPSTNWDEKLNEYLASGIPLVWIVNPDRKTIRIYRNDGTTKVFAATDTIANEPLLPGFSLVVGDIFPK